MSSRPLTMDAVRLMDHPTLLIQLEALMTEYDPPEGPEIQSQRLARLNRTIDEMPGMYRYLIQLWSYLDNLTDGYAIAYGNRDLQYKQARQRRDLLEKYASAAKLRYEAASRVITVLQSFDSHGMPTSRRDG